LLCLAVVKLDQSSRSSTERRLIDERLFTVGEIAAHLRVNEFTVRRWLREGRLRGFRLGGPSGWRIRASDLDSFIRRAEEREERDE
jgi:excisionase family DNA binding protein